MPAILAAEFKKPINDREYEALRTYVMRAYQAKIDLHAAPLIAGSAADYADYKRRAAVVTTWADAYAEFDELLRKFVTGDDDSDWDRSPETEK